MIAPKKLKAFVQRNAPERSTDVDEEDAASEIIAEVERNVKALKENLAHANPEPSPETRKKIRAQMSGMPSQMRAGFKKWAGGQKFERLREKAQELADEGKIEDPDRFAGWMYWAGKV